MLLVTHDFLSLTKASWRDIAVSIGTDDLVDRL